MKKLTALLKTIDNNLLNALLVLFVFAIPLYPKLPLIFIEYTYIYIRAEDFFIALINIVFVIQLLRRKVKLNTLFLPFFLAYFAVVLGSFFSGTYITKTLPYREVALLHAFRRFEYMSIFFVASSTIKNWRFFKTILISLFICLFFVSIYGMGQRFFGLPAVSTMNPAFATGILLQLSAEARIPSTFAGHYDLGAFLVFVMPILWGMYFISGKKMKVFLAMNALLSYFILMFTASRISLGAYVATPLFLLYMKKYSYAIVVIGLSIFIFLFNTNLSKRISQTFQLRQIFVNQTTGQVIVPQKLNATNLPAGSLIVGGKNAHPQKLSLAEAERLAQEASASGNLTSTQSANLIANSAHITTQQSIVADTSLATRLQVEWPRAIKAFMKNPLLGTGASSITESTDGDYFRLIGEFGALGAITFGAIIFAMSKYIYRKAQEIEKQRPLLVGVLFGVFALLINAVMIDVFEASKVAFMFWLILGTYIGYLSHVYPDLPKNTKKA